MCRTAILSNAWPSQRTRIDALGLDGAMHDAESEGDGLVILRHTLMNPFLIDDTNGISYIDRYFDFLGEITSRLLSKATPQR